MSKELKTLKEIEQKTQLDYDATIDFVRESLSEELREEAKKWLEVFEKRKKEHSKFNVELLEIADLARITFIKHFFNLEDEDGN
jgi:hypothetical protein